MLSAILLVLCCSAVLSTPVTFEFPAPDGTAGNDRSTPLSPIMNPNATYVKFESTECICGQTPSVFLTRAGNSGSKSEMLTAYCSQSMQPPQMVIRSIQLDTLRVKTEYVGSECVVSDPTPPWTALGTETDVVYRLSWKDWIAMKSDVSSGWNFTIFGQEKYGIDLMVEPLLHEGTVYVVDCTGRLCALSERNGQPLWCEHIDIEWATSSLFRIAVDMTPKSHRLFIVSTNQTVGQDPKTFILALDRRDGSILWKVKPGFSIHGVQQVDHLISSGNHVLMWSRDKFVVLDSSSGARVWGMDEAPCTIPGLEAPHTPIVLPNGDVVVVCPLRSASDAQVVIQRIATPGVVVWSVVVGSYPNEYGVATCPLPEWGSASIFTLEGSLNLFGGQAIAGAFVGCSSSSGYVNVTNEFVSVDIESGNILWRYTVFHGMHLPPAAYLDCTPFSDTDEKSGLVCIRNPPFWEEHDLGIALILRDGM